MGRKLSETNIRGKAPNYFVMKLCKMFKRVGASAKNNTSRAALGELAHRLEHRTAWNTPPPDRSKMTTRVPKNGRQGLDIGPMLGYYTLQLTFALYVF